VPAATDHPRVAAWLHIVSGLCILLVMSGTLAWVASSYGSSTLPEGVKAILGTVGLAVGTALSLVAGLELLGGVALLSGKALGRPVLLLSSVFQLANVPFGTALGLYTFWALLRSR
jgi:hypothetical protein